MQVILHAGAHRCATTSFQEYMRQNAETLREGGVGFWGPHRTRNGLLHGILPAPGVKGARDLSQRAQGRLRMNLNRSRENGVRHLLISDENVIGNVRSNLRLTELYSGIGERMARFAEAFDGQLTDLAFNIRSLETFWTSSLAYAVARGHRVPVPAQLQALAENTRGWRDVLTDVACALPGVNIHVLPFEWFGGRPELQVEMLTGVTGPRSHARVKLNSSLRLEELHSQLPGFSTENLPEGEGRWRPFDEYQTAELRERYADDLMWLMSGADGLVQLVQDPEKTEAGPNLLRSDLTRGRPHDQNRRLAGSG